MTEAEFKKKIMHQIKRIERASVEEGWNGAAHPDDRVALRAWCSGTRNDAIKKIMAIVMTGRK